ncbi:MAG: tetratricopeptide repeat protein, partial [Erysipelotrichaceae bacterium]|nr:tetratricopeptide repeat protein [Erysipelotrichaceae bacterium]
MFWDILGIQPTKDKKAITQAYREKLLDTNPEDKPEEFKQLRSAYEEALKYAESQQSAMKTEKDAVDLWRDQLEELYRNYPERIKLENWKQLFEQEVCQSLDSRMKIEETLIVFLMDNYFIPHALWQFFDEQFSWKERIDDLYENYPNQFIDYIIINGINNPDTLPMDMFIPGLDGEIIQQYLSLYLKIRNQGSQESKELIDEMLSLPEQHPYGNALALSYRINFEAKEAIRELEELQKKYPEDLHIANILIIELFQQERYEEAEKLCEHFIETNPDHNQLKYLYANVLEKRGDYDKAITQINDLMRNAGGNHQYLNELDQLRRQWNEKVMEIKQQQIAENPDDQQLKLDLGWAYLENDLYDKAREIIETVDRKKADMFDYYNLSSAISYTGKKYVRALDALDNLIELIKNLPEDGDEKTRKRKSRLGEMYGRKGSYLHAIDKNEDAMEYYKLALKSATDKASILTNMIIVALNTRDYPAAEEYARQLILERSDAFHGYLFLAYSLFHQNRDRESFDAINHA